MDVKLFDQGIIKKFENLVRSNADKKEVGQLYHEVYKRGLAGNPSVKKALKRYQNNILQELHSFITDLSKEAKDLGQEKALSFGYNRTMKAALYELLDLGGLPDNKIGKIAEEFNMDLNKIATKILRHKQEVIIYDDITDVICGTIGLTYLAEQATQTIKNDMQLYSDLAEREHISTTLDMGKNQDRDYYNLDCIFDGNGECQSISIKQEESNYPITIDVKQVPYLTFSKNDVKKQDKSQDER